MHLGSNDLSESSYLDRSNPETILLYHETMQI